MSFVVIGMDYPEHCVECKLRHSGIHDFCIIEERDFDDEDCDDMERNDWHPDWCSLRQLPEKHGRMIDADDFASQMKNRQIEAEKWLREAKGRETAIRADAVLSFICEVKLTLDKTHTIVEAEGE